MPDGREILVLGGGLAGCLAALALQRAGLSASLYEAGDPSADEGLFLNLAPNGVNALRALDLGPEVEPRGFRCARLELRGARGEPLGAVGAGDDEARFGAPTLIFRRADLRRALWGACLRRGVRAAAGKALASLTPRPDGVLARFADGTSAEGALALGCDGVGSIARRAILPRAPAPRYTGLLGFGGFAPALSTDTPPGVMRMTFGKRAFFGHVPAPDGSVWWFSNVPADQPPPPDTATDWRARLLDLHAADPSPIPEILAATPGPLRCYPLFDLPPLPAWSAGRVCLLGDAAHAATPHAGQGASLALEDALELARCLRDIPDPERAFAAYERLRRPRAERLAAQARRTGATKAAGPLQAWLRDRTLPLVLRLTARSNDWIYQHRIPWEASAA